MNQLNFDGTEKSPDAALRCILRHCGVPEVRLTPQNLRALPANFLQSRPNVGFLPTHQILTDRKRPDLINLPSRDALIPAHFESRMACNFLISPADDIKNKGEG